MSGEQNRPNIEDLQKELETVKRDLAVQQATQAGAQATMSATQAGTWSTITSGFVAFIVGLFLGMTIVTMRK